MLNDIFKRKVFSISVQYTEKNTIPHADIEPSTLMLHYCFVNI